MKRCYSADPGGNFVFLQWLKHLILLMAVRTEREGSRTSSFGSVHMSFTQPAGEFPHRRIPSLDDFRGSLYRLYCLEGGSDLS